MWYVIGYVIGFLGVLGWSVWAWVVVDDYIWGGGE